jgi:hypothetical protein
LAVFPLLAVAYGQKPSVAYADGREVVLASADGQVLQRTPVTVDIGAIAFSPASGRLVIQSEGEWGGNLYLVEPHTGLLRNLIPRPLYFKKLTKNDKDVPESERERINREEHEVYADPEFDPTGNLLVFAVHDSGPGAWDAVLASGPLAVLNFHDFEARVLESTLLKEQDGPAYASDPHWSPDGTRILWSHEAGSELTLVGAKTSIDLSGWFELKGDELGYAECWLDNHSILYAVLPSGLVPDPIRFSVLDLSTRRSRLATEVLGIEPALLEGARSLSVTQNFILIRRGNEPEVYDRKNHRLLFLREKGGAQFELVEP